MSKLIAFFAATLLAATAMAAVQQDEHDKGQHEMNPTAATFDSLDKNSDSQISKTEAATDEGLSDGFASIDTNADGYLSKTEYTAYMRQRS